MELSNYALREQSEPVETAGVFTDERRTLRDRLSSLILLTTGVAVFIWAVSSPLFRDKENFLSGKFCLPLAVSIALIVFGSFVIGRWRRTAGWFALALVGQAVSLQMVYAGRLIHYQHYQPLNVLFNKEHFFLTAFVLFQTLIVALGIRKHLSAIVGWIRQTFSVWKIIAIALVLFLSGAVVSSDLMSFKTELLLAGFIQLVNLANIILLAIAIPSEKIEWLKEKINGVIGEAKTTEIRKTIFVDRFVLLAALWVFVVAATLNFFIYERHPHVPDEVQYIFQARYMAQGQLTVKAPPVPEAFSLYMIPTDSNRWYSIFPPGWSMVLALGAFVGAMWLVNPLLAGLNILLAYGFFQEIYSRRFARIAVLLLCCSPWNVFMAMNFMSHTFTITCALVAACALCKARKARKVGWATGAGFTIGFASLIRPLDGLILAGLFTLWVFASKSLWSVKLKHFLALTIGTLIIGAAVLPYNKAVTGSATLMPLDAYYSTYFGTKSNALGFGAERGLGWGLDAYPGHSPFEAAINAQLNTHSINTELLGWGIGSLILSVLFLFSGAMQRKDYWALVAVVIVVGAYSLYWFSGGPDFGARYWFLIIVPLMALTIRGIEFLKKNLQGHETRIFAAVAVLCLMSVVSYFPWRALDKYHHYLGMRPDIRELAHNQNFGRSLVLIRGNNHTDYHSAWVYNPVDFEGDAPIYAWDKNAEIRTQLLKAYADRPVWIVDGPSLTDSGYKVKQGPIAANELLAEENQ